MLKLRHVFAKLLIIVPIVWLCLLTVWLNKETQSLNRLERFKFKRTKQEKQVIEPPVNSNATTSIENQDQKQSKFDANNSDKFQLQVQPIIINTNDSPGLVWSLLTFNILLSLNSFSNVYIE